MAGAGRSGYLPVWYKQMEKELECPVCLIAFLDPPIYVCENQHGLCLTCRNKLTRSGRPCPVCNGKLTDKRCLIVERMLDNLPKTKCVYPECSFKRADHQAALDHQEDCIHRKAPCGFCNEKVAMSSLNQHLLNHGIECREQGQWHMYFAYEGQQPMEGPDLGPVFYLNGMLLDDNRSMLWVSYNGSKKDRKKYQFVIEVLNPTDDRRTVRSFMGFCVPCDVTRDEVKEKDLGFIINKDLAQEVQIGGNPDSPQYSLKVDFFVSQ